MREGGMVGDGGSMERDAATLHDEAIYSILFRMEDDLRT